MKKIFAIVVLIAMMSVAYYQIIPNYKTDNGTGSIGSFEEIPAGESEEVPSLTTVEENEAIPQCRPKFIADGVNEEGPQLVRPDGTIDPVIFQQMKEELQTANDKISNPPPVERSRFQLTTATGIAFLYPTNWPRVMYLENYSVVGVVFEDSNENGIYNTGEVGVPNAPVHVYWGPGTTREILPPPVSGATQATLGAFSTYFDVTETQEGNYRLNFSFRGLTTRNGTSYYEHTPGSPPPGGHWLAKEPSTWPTWPYVPLEDYEVEIWHEVNIDFQITSPNLENIEVGDTLEISGTLEDYHLGWGLSQKVLHMKFDNNPVYPSTVDTTGTGTFSYQYTIPETIRPGKHTFSIEYHSGHTDPQTQEKVNYYYVDNASVIEFKVHRPTHFIVEDRTVYRTDTINITGAIVDNRGEGLDGTIANETFQYEVIINWGDPTDLYYEPGMVTVPLPSGNFTRQFTIKKTQPLTRVHLTFHFRVKNAEHGATMYYREATGEAYYTVKARTIIELFVMDKDGKDELDTVARTGPTSTFKISGVLWDKDQKDATGHYTAPIEKMAVKLYWDIEHMTPLDYRVWSCREYYSEPLAVLTTDQFGRFSKEITLLADDPIGPVTIQAVMDDTYWYKGFDTDSYTGEIPQLIYMGKVIDVVSKTTVEIYTGEQRYDGVWYGRGIKGENPTIEGILKDDSGHGISNRSVRLHWKKTKFAPLGSSIGAAMTDHFGYFQFSSFQIPKTQSVGDAFVFGIFDGSNKVPHPKDGHDHYARADAYDYSDSGDVKFDIASYVIVSIDPSILNGSKFTRGDTIKISGEVVEAFDEQRTSPPRYVKGVRVSSYLIKGEDDWVKLPDTTTDDFGQYEIVATVPKSLEVGEYTLKMGFNESQKYKTKDKRPFIDSRSIIIMADTQIKIVEKPDDVTGDEIPDIGYLKGKKEIGYKFSMLLLEKNTLLNEQVPVPNGTVTLTITLWDDKGSRYVNITTLKSDSQGRVDFNFSTGFYSNGVQIREPGLGASGKAFFEFRGSTYLTKIEYEEDINFIARDKEIPAPTIWDSDWWTKEHPEALVGLSIFLVLLIIGMTMLIIYLRKRARIRGIKRIIKRAADQLIAGNEYTAVIFKSYQKLGMHLRKYGYLRREAETFREFEGAVRTALPVDQNSLNGFLTILEEARYSSHEIGESQRDKAVTNLRKIEHSLTYIEINEEDALKKLEESEADFVETEIILQR